MVSGALVKLASMMAARKVHTPPAVAHRPLDGFVIRRVCGAVHDNKYCLELQQMEKTELDGTSFRIVSERFAVF